MSTLRVSNIEAKADVSSPTVDEKIKFTNSSGDVLFHLDGKTSGITTVGINTTGNTFTVNNTTGDVSFSGSVTSSGVSTFTSDVSIADKIVHIGDTNTAIRFPAADTFTVETGGTERLRIDSSGNVTVDTNTLFVGAVSNRVGVGTTIPSTPLDVNGMGKLSSVQITDGTYGLDITPRAYGVQLETRGTNQAIDIRSYGTTTASYITLATQNTERLRITSSGDVGIGDTTPAEKLEVKGDVLISTGQNATLYLGKGAEGVDGVTKIKSVQTGADTDELGIAFFTHPSTFGSANAVEKLRIDATGSMGLGVVPEPQGSGFTHFQFGGLGNLGASSSQSAGGAIYLYNNVYRATVGQWYYLVTDEATRYQSLNGQHRFDVAPSGTADTIASFAEKVRIDTDGMKFNGDTSAANALDDYEEGTWLPTFQGEAGNNNPTVTYLSRKARYTKIGRFVSVHGFFRSATVSNTGTTLLQIGNLPFTVGISNDTDYVSAVTIGNATNWNNSAPNGGYLRESQTGAYLTRNDGTNWELIETNHLQNTSSIFFTINYITSA